MTRPLPNGTVIDQTITVLLMQKGDPIDGTSIGANQPADGAFTTLTVGGNPTQPLQVAPKQYVDAQMAMAGKNPPNAALLGGAGGNFVPISVSGSLTLAGGSLAVASPYAPNAVAINGGSIDGTPIGSATPGPGSFTTLAATGQVVFSSGSPLSTTATSGFVYIPTCAGVPTGTPAAQTGAQPLVIDTTDNRLYFYSSGAWTQAGGGGGSAPPNASLLGGNGTSFTVVSVGTGLGLVSGNLTVSYGTTAGTAAQGNDSRITGALQATNNLSDVGSAATAWTNLGGGSLGKQASSAAAITGGTIDGTSIGATTAASIRGTTLTLTTSQTANQVYAAPSGAAGAPGFRALTAADLPLATASAVGGVQVGANIAVSSGNISVATATASALGVAQAGTGLGVASGVFSVSYGTAAGTAAQGNDSRITGALQAANNLSDVSAANTARNNIDKGTAALTSGATVATNCANGNVFTLTLATNATLSNPTNLAAGAHYMWIITQDATGSRTLAYGTVFKWANKSAPTLSTPAGSVDIISAVSDGTNVYATFTPNFG